MRAVLGLLALAACSGGKASSSGMGQAAGPPTASAVVASEPSSTASAPDAAVPVKLREVAGSFGVTMLGNGWQWTELSRSKTRFDWSGLPPSGAYEVRWSFWLKGDEAKSIGALLPQVVQSAAMNLTTASACAPFDQPADIVQLTGADRIITVCFEPAPYVTDKFRRGVLHGLVHGDVLVIVIVLANDWTGTVPLPQALGGRF